ncbi:MAG: hypothetical protein Q9201_005925 [Fulgogasparrea decipioides]
MDRGAPDQYSQSDPASAAQYTPQQDVRPSNFANSATPTSEFGVNPSSARSANLNPDYLARQQYAQQQQHNSHASAASMAQATSPSMSLHDGQQNNHHNPPHVKSNSEVPIDPSIAASSPTYPPYSPYAHQGHDMAQYQGHPPHGYQGWPQQYAGHPSHGLPGGPYSSPGSAVSAGGAVATAGPRTGQFKEIRKEWKQRKKEEEAQRKSEDERQRGSTGGQSVDGQAHDPAQTTSGQNYPPGARPHLPPIGYAPAAGAMQPQYASGVEQMYQAQGNGQVYAGYPPHSPYGQGQQM